MTDGRRRQQRREQLRMRLILFFLVLLVGLCAVIFYVNRHTPSKKHMDAAEYFGISGEEAAVIVDGTVSETKGMVLDGTVWPDYESVQNLISRSIFYDEKESKLIVTTADAKEVYPVSGGSSETKEARIVDGVLYISPDFVNRYSACSAEIKTDPARMVVRTRNSYRAVRTSRDSEVRYRAGIKSPILEDVPEGTLLETLDPTDPSSDGGTSDETGTSPSESALSGTESSGRGSSASSDEKIDGWTHVTTEDGFTGYIEDRDLDGTVTDEAVDLGTGLGEYTTHQLGEKVNMVFHQTTSQESNDALSSYLGEISGVNVIAPTWFFLNGTNGEVSSLASSSYVSEAHDAGLKVWAVFNDFDGAVNSSDSTSEALSTDTSRSAMVETVMNGLLESGADGLNLDFERVSENAAPAFLELVREFSVECRKEGLTLSVDNFVPTFTAYMDRREQARVTDYVVVMCYDEHTSSSSEPGSVASLPFVKAGIAETAAEVGADKTVAAIPFFTRLWETRSDGSLTSTAYGMSDAAAAMEALGMKASWNEETGQNYAETESGDIRYRIWVEDAESIAAKMQAVSEAGCAGVAEWKLGFETPDIWQVISDGLKNS